jgi:type VI secretion system secreted protein VgrG
VDGVDASDRAKGPGHGTSKIDGTCTETVGSVKALGSLSGINTNVGATMSVSVGAANIEMILGNRAESVEGAKSEQAVGLVVATKGDESEQVGGVKNTTVGGAVFDIIKGKHSVEAGAPASFIGAFHKIQAKSKITFKCGGSTLVIDGGGVTFTAPVVTFTAGKIYLPKAVSEG